MMSDMHGKRQDSNREQYALWNGGAGRAWVDQQALLDRVFRPFEDLLFETVPRDAGHRILDVGCGTGSTTLAAARRVGAKGYCVGVDVSAPMIATARARAGQAPVKPDFVQADAQTHAFAPGGFDLIVSRFGVMFFDDPVAAFANLRGAARDGGQLRMIVWRDASENPFMTTAERAAAPLLPNLPARQPGGPGQFAFADPHRVSSLLGASGWTAIGIEPVNADCTLPTAELEGYYTRMGPVGLVLDQVDAPTRARIVKTLRAAFEPFVCGPEVRFTAACWLVTARTRSVADAPREPVRV
jgi:SAM-dependent methyltransferase